MKKIHNKVADKIKGFFPEAHADRREFIAQFIIGLIESRSVNLTKVANKFKSESTKPESIYRRI